MMSPHYRYKDNSHSETLTSYQLSCTMCVSCVHEQEGESMYVRVCVCGGGGGCSLRCSYTAHFK